jgi:1,4-alpha-glucan branching enzyme
MVSKKFFKTKDECEVTFEYDGDGVESVALVASVNDWNPVEMSKRKKDGIFYTRLRVPTDSQFQFRYLVDGSTWVNDPAADALVPNEHGDRNSQITTAQTS